MFIFQEQRRSVGIGDSFAAPLVDPNIIIQSSFLELHFELLEVHASLALLASISCLTQMHRLEVSSHYTLRTLEQ